MESNSLGWALVTGSSSGIGLAIAQHLSSLGYSLVLHGLESQEQLDGLAQKFNGKTIAVSADLSKTEDVYKIISLIQTKKINLQVIINNAGFQHISPIENFPLDIWQKMLAVHLTAPMILIQNLLPHMKTQKWGRIINIASVHGLIASKNKSAYVAAKHGLMGLTKAVALETAGQGVTCNAICPGWVQTPLVENQIQLKSKNENITIDQAKHLLLSEKQPSGEFITTSQIVSLIQYLCSKEGAGMTGSTLTLDGGWTSQ
jgi:3-hydroxybutyrate dehydrogenase